MITNPIHSFNFIIIEKLTESLFLYLCSLLSFVQVQSLIQLLANIWKFLLQTLKKIHHFPYISWYCTIFAPNNKNLLPIHAIKNVDHRPVLILVLVLINQYSYSYSCNNQVLGIVLVLTHIASTRTCTRTRKSGTRPSPASGVWAKQMIATSTNSSYRR